MKFTKIIMKTTLGAFMVFGALNLESVHAAEAQIDATKDLGSLRKLAKMHYKASETHKINAKSQDQVDALARVANSDLEAIMFQDDKALKDIVAGKIADKVETVMRSWNKGNDVVLTADATLGALTSKDFTAAMAKMLADAKVPVIAWPVSLNTEEASDTAARCKSVLEADLQTALETALHANGNQIIMLQPTKDGWNHAATKTPANGERDTVIKAIIDSL